MIVCSCNRLSDHAISACCGGADAPKRVVDVYGRLGCAPQCGRCATTVAAIMKHSREQGCACAPGCCGCADKGASARAA